MILTIKPGDRDTFKEDEEEQAHATGRVVIKKLEDINAPLKGTQGENSPVGIRASAREMWWGSESEGWG